MKVAIITARGGSKRIPRKNIREFLGKPIIAYSIEAALSSQLFDEVMVSTEDDEIAEIGQRYGAAVPFRRSQKTADDYSTTVDVLLEVLEEYKMQGKDFAVGCCIYPTAPFVTAEKLQSGLEHLLEQNFDIVFPVVKFGFPIMRALKLSNRHVTPQFQDMYLKRSQDLPESYHDAGQFYWFQVQRLLEAKSLVTENTGAIVVSENSVQDIDTLEDWEIAEIKYQYLMMQNQ